MKTNELFQRIRAFQYIGAWNQRSARTGSVVVVVHLPEFCIGHDTAAVNGIEGPALVSGQQKQPTGGQRLSRS